MINNKLFFFCLIDWRIFNVHDAFMCSVRTFAFSIALFVVTLFEFTKPASASNEDQLQYFATCAGRLSAVMEFQWMFDGAGSETTARHRAAVIELIEAIMLPNEGRTVLNWRISAKHAQSALLTRATFNDDPEDAKWATGMADRLTRECTSLLLS